MRNLVAGLFHTSIDAEPGIGNLIDCPAWRDEYMPSDRPVHFLLRKFDDAMQRIGYLSAAGQLHPVKIHGMSVLQYMLAFYSKNPVGVRLWKEGRDSLSSQLELKLFQQFAH